MEICKECECKCRPINKDCVTRFSDIKDVTILDSSHYEKATDDISTMIGDDCADELCNALKQASIDAEEHNTANPTDIKAAIDFLDDAWKVIIENKQFKMWYANRLLWHWVFGASTSEITASGLVTTRNNDDAYKADSEHAGPTERQRIQNSAKFYSEKARNKFKNKFWNEIAHNYDCAELDCGCTKHTKCEKHGDKPRAKNRIGITVI